MKSELYLSPRERRELRAAVRERTIAAPGSRPRCEWCGKEHGRLKRNREGYLVPQWLHTAHRKGAPYLSKNPADYLCLCAKCHMAYDRAPGELGLISRYRPGYATTTTDTLQQTLAAIGLDLWGVVDQGWYWRMGTQEGGPEETPARAVAAAVARISRLAAQDGEKDKRGGQGV